MNAIISMNPQAHFTGEPEIIESIDITQCLLLIRHLSEVADFVDKYPSTDNFAKEMAWTIKQIERALMYEHPDIRAKVESWMKRSDP